ncbi:MAG: polyphosphate kinase 2 [Lentisphaeria bacterium]|nr:polyphosphate kinase 2 [Lentisphaeria bacterium]
MPAPNKKFESREMTGSDYRHELARLQAELVKMQEWIRHTRQKVVVIFEGRDAAGKGGVINRITHRLNHRVCRVAALPAPTPAEESQWYFQRYIHHLPSGGEMVLFDRSWYTLPGVERVMGFYPEATVQDFFRTCPEFERMLVRAGTIIVKYWFRITSDEQERRFQARLEDPAKRWKLSKMDVESRAHWGDYTRARDDMLEKTDIPEAPWWIVEANDKKKARLNCIAHLLSQIHYHELPPQLTSLPDRTKTPKKEDRFPPFGTPVPSIY